MKAKHQEIHRQFRKRLITFCSPQAAYAALVGALLFVCQGCGGGSEDFSKPPAQLAGKAATAPGDTKANGTKKDEPASAESVGMAAEKAKASEDSESGSVIAEQDATKAVKPSNAASEPSESSNKPASDDTPTQTPESGGGLLGLLNSSDAVDKPASGSKAAAASAVAPARSVIASDISASGNTLVSERADARIGVYETQKRAVLMSLKAAEPDVSLLRFDDASKIVAAALPSGKIQLWKYRSVAGLDKFGQQLAAEQAFFRTLSGHAGGTSDIAYSPTRPEIASTGADGFLRLWRLDDSDAIRTYETAVGELQFVTVSEKGVAAAITGPDEVTVWHLESGEKKIHKIAARTFTCLAIDGDGLVFAVGDSTGHIQLVHSKEETTDELVGHTSEIADLQFDKMMPRLLSITKSGESRIWELPVQPSRMLEKLTGSGGLLAVSEGGGRVVSPSGPGSLSLRKKDSEKSQQSLLTTIRETKALRFAGEDIIVAGDTGRLNVLRDDNTGIEISVSDGELADFSAGGRGKVVTVDQQGRSFVWSYQVPTMIRENKSNTDNIVASNFDPSGKLAVWVTTSGRLSISDMTDGRIVASWMVPVGSAKRIDIGSQSRCVVTADTAGTLVRWDIDAPGTPTGIGQCPAAVTSLEMSADGSLVYAACENGEVKTVPVRPDSGKDELTFTAAQQAMSKVWSRSSPSLVAFRDSEVQFVDTAKGAAESLLCPENVLQATISDDGRQVAVVTASGRILLFRRGRKEATVLREPVSDKVAAISFCPRSAEICLLHESGTVSSIVPLDVPEKLPDDFRQIVASSENLSIGITAFGTSTGNVYFASSRDLSSIGEIVRCELPVTHVAWLDNRTVLAAVEGDTSPRIISLDTSVAKKSTVSLPGRIRSLVRSGSADEVLAITETKLLRLAHSDGDLQMKDLMLDVTDDMQLASSEKGVLVCSAGRLYRIAGGNDVRPVSLVREATGVLAAGMTEVVLTKDGTIYRLANGKSDRIGRSEQKVVSGAVSQDEQFLLLCSESGTVSLWSLTRRDVHRDLEVGNGKRRHVAFVSDSHGVLIADRETSRILSLPSEASTDTTISSPRSLQFAEDGQDLIVTGQNEICVLPKNGTVRRIATSGESLACFGATPNIVFLAEPNGTLRRITGDAEESVSIPGSVRQMVFDRRHGKLLILPGSGNDLLTVDPLDLKQISSKPLEAECRELASTVEGIVGLDVNGVSKLLVQNPMTSVTAKAHDGACIGIVALGQDLWTAGSDGLVRKWTADFAQSSEFLKHPTGFSSIQPTSDGSALLLTDLAGKAIRVPISNPRESVQIDMPDAMALAVDSPENDEWLFLHNGRLLYRSRIHGDSEMWTSAPIAGVCRLMDDRSSPKYFSVNSDTGLSRFALIQRKAIRTGPAGTSQVHAIGEQSIAFVTSAAIDIYDYSGVLQKSLSLVGGDAIASTLSGNGEQLLLSLRTGEIAAYGTSDWARKHQFRLNKPASLISCDEQGDVLLVAGGTNEIELWDIQRGVFLRVLKGHESVVRTMFFAGKRTEIVSSDVEGEVRSWGEPRVQTNQIAVEDPADFRLLPDGIGAISLTAKGELTVWDQFSRKSWQMATSLKNLQPVSIDSDGRRIAIAETAPAAKLTIYDRNTAEIRTIAGEKSESITFSTDGRRLFTAGPDSIRSFDTTTGQPASTVNSKAAAVLSATTDHIVFVGKDGRLQRVTESQLADIRITSVESTALAYNDDGDLIAAGDSDGIITVWQRKSGELRKIRELRTEGAVRQIIYSGKLIVCRSDSPIIRFWVTDGTEKEAAVSVNLDHTEIPLLMRMDTRQEFLLTAGAENSAYLWYLDFSPGPPRKVLSIDGHEKSLIALAFNEAQRTIVSVDAGGIVAANPLPDISELRQKNSLSRLEVQSAGILDDLPKEDPVRRREGNDLLTQQLLAQEKFRRERTSSLPNNVSGSRPKAADAKSEVESLEKARTAQLVMNLSSESPANGGGYLGLLNAAAGARLNGGELPTSLASGDMTQRLQEIESAPGELKAVAEGGNQNVPATSAQAKSLQRKLVENQKSLVRNLNNLAVDSLLNRFFGKGTNSKERERLQSFLQAAIDSRAVQSIRTDILFPKTDRPEGDYQIRISSDGRTIAVSAPMLGSDSETISGSRVDIWDMLTGVCLKQFESKESVQQIHLTPEEAHLVTLPDAVAYPLFQETPARPLTKASHIVFQHDREKSVAAFARILTRDKLEPLIQFYDSATMENLHVRLPEGYNTEIRDFCFAFHEDVVALSISPTDNATTKQHRLYICTRKQLESFETVQPLETINDETGENNRGTGFVSLAFARDDSYLMAIAMMPDGKYLVAKFERIKDQWALTAQLPLDPSLRPTAGRVSIESIQGTGRILVRTDTGLFLVDKFGVARKKQQVTTWAIRFPPEMTCLSISENGRWAVIGTSAGLIETYDLAGPDPARKLLVPGTGGPAHEGPVLSVTFSRPLAALHDPAFLVSLGKENRIKVWDGIDIADRSVAPAKK